MQLHNIKQSKLPFSLSVAVALDIFLDWLLIGIGFSAGKEEGMLLAFALSGALLSLGMATASDLTENKISKSKSIIILIILALIFFPCAVPGGIFLQNLSPNILGFILSFGVSVLLFLAAEEL